MIDSNPKPLPQHRLGRLVQGLRSRMSGSLQQTAAKVEELRQQIEHRKHELSQITDRLQRDYAQLKESTVTEWDEAKQQRWDAAELRTYKAIYETADQEKRYKTETKKRIELTTQEAQRKISEVESRFLKAKEVPIGKLRKFRAANNDLKDHLTALRSQATAVLAQRSLAIPDSQDDAVSKELPDLQHSAEAYKFLGKTIEEAKQQAQKITNNPLARFVDSIVFWIFCVIFFVGVVAVLVSLQVQELIPAMLSASGATLSLVLIAYLGVRPWLKKFVKREFPQLHRIVEKGEAIHRLGDGLAVKENEAELSALAKKRDENFLEIKRQRDAAVDALQTQLSQQISKLRQGAKEEKYSARAALDGDLSETEQEFHQRIKVERSQSEDAIAENRSATDLFCKTLEDTIEEIDQGGAHRLRVAAEKAVDFISRSSHWCQQHFPDWQALQASESSWPESLHIPQIPLGRLSVDEILPEAERVDVPAKGLKAPVLFSPLEDKYLVIHAKPTQAAVKQLVRGILLRALTTLPAGRTQVCVIDPPGLGQEFGWLMHLGDFDAQLVTHRVWTQTSHIGQQLATLAMAAEDFIQQSLRNEYKNIAEYNLEAGALAEPYRILVWSSIPNGLDEHGWKNLKSILDSGARCGIIPILIADPDESWPYKDQLATLEREGLHLEWSNGRFLVKSRRHEDLPFETFEPPTDEQAQQIVQEVGRRSLLSNRVEVPLERMVPALAERWQGDSSHSLEIPIGQSGVGRTHCLKLGIGTAQHAIIAGKTGSGKSSLLHALITSAMLKYSPDALRLVLLDFKKGVEFQVYSDSQVPHADIIGIESHREFGLSALEYVDGCLQRRGEMFRAAGVQDIASWNALKPQEKLPRMLIVVDEFQEIFVEDDKLSSQASLILDRIVRQGRSFGVHAILSSQTLAGSYSLPRTTLGQMAVRIALQCDPSDAQIIFSEDNPAAARLKHPGQAVYNDAGGRIEGNQPMQIGWLPKSQQLEWFQQQTQGYQNHDASTNLLGRTVIYDGNRAATWSSTNANLAIEQARKNVNPDAIWCVAGESVAINPAVVYPLTKQSGRNVLLVGGDDAQAAAVQDVAVQSFARHAESACRIFAIQGAKPTDAKCLTLPKRWENLPGEVQCVDSRQTDEIIAAVHAIVQERTEGSTDAQEQPTVLLSLIQIGRLRSLRKEDDFASFGESELTPDKQLEEILRDGPSVGVHTMIWAESYSTVNRWLSRASLREIEIRLLMQMSANDSTNLVDSIAASRLGENVMLLFDEATGQEQRFRPFAPDSLEELTDWATG